LLVVTIVLMAAGCSYKVKSDQVQPVAASPAPQPLQLTVAIPDTPDPLLSSLGVPAESIREELAADFVAALERSQRFTIVRHVPLSAPYEPAAGTADLVAQLLHRPGAPGADNRWIQQLLVYLSGLKLAPFLESHETFTMTAELTVARPDPADLVRRYVGMGTATLSSKVYAPREQAVREAIVAAGRAANAKLVEQIAQEDLSVQ
jgi:hypothetical protein